MFRWVSIKIQELFCKHEWKFEENTSVMKEGYDLPIRREKLFICEKCCSSKIIKY